MGPAHGPQTAPAPSWLACFVLGRACDWAALTATSPLVSLGLDVDLQREATQGSPPQRRKAASVWVGFTPPDSSAKPARSASSFPASGGTAFA